MNFSIIFRGKNVNSSSCIARYDNNRAYLFRLQMYMAKLDKTLAKYIYSYILWSCNW